MSAGATPQQGDHVFNAIEVAIMRPFESIRSFHSELVDRQHFIHDYLLHSYSMARDMADTPILVAARNLVASAGAEADALREVSALRSRYPVLARVNANLLHEIHLRNSDQFGAAARRFEFEILNAVRQSLERAVADPAANPAGPLMASPGIACQQMLNAAYDPAAALVIVTSSMSRETPTAQSVFRGAIVGIAETLDRPGMWKDPYDSFRQDRPSATGGIIEQIRDVLLRLDMLKVQSMRFAAMIKGEISQKTRPPHTDAMFGNAIHLLHSRLQQMGGGHA